MWDAVLDYKAQAILIGHEGSVTSVVYSLIEGAYYPGRKTALFGFGIQLWALKSCHLFMDTWVPFNGWWHQGWKYADWLWRSNFMSSRCRSLQIVIFFCKCVISFSLTAGYIFWILQLAGEFPHWCYIEVWKPGAVFKWHSLPLDIGTPPLGCEIYGMRAIWSYRCDHSSGFLPQQSPNWLLNKARAHHSCLRCMLWIGLSNYNYIIFFTVM